jgi:hypothetical protein
MGKRSLTVALRTTLLLVIVSLTSGSAAPAKTQEKSDSKNMENSLVASYKTEAPALPPIDAAAPSTYETASFGLG